MTVQFSHNSHTHLTILFICHILINVESIVYHILIPSSLLWNIINPPKKIRSDGLVIKQGHSETLAPCIF